MASEVDFGEGYSFGSHSRLSQSNNFDNMSGLESDFLQGFEEHQHRLRTNESVDSDFLTEIDAPIKPPAVSASNSQLNSLLSQLQSDGSNYFSRNDHEDEDVMSVQTPTSDWFEQEREKMKSAASSFFDIEAVDDGRVNTTGNNETHTPDSDKNYFQNDYDDATSLLSDVTLTSVPENKSSKHVVKPSGALPYDSNNVTERSYMSLSEFTERSITIDADYVKVASSDSELETLAASPSNTEHADLRHSQQSSCKAETPESLEYVGHSKLGASSHQPIDTASEISLSENEVTWPPVQASTTLNTLTGNSIVGNTSPGLSDLIDPNSPEPDTFRTDSQMSTFSSKSAKKKEHQSYIERKYEAMQKQREQDLKESDKFKTQFVNEMLARAKDNQNQSKSSRQGSASNYPRGVVLSKTFTKNTKSFKAWSETKNGGLKAHKTTNGVTEPLSNLGGGDSGVVCSSPPIVSHAAPTSSAVPQWQVHDPQALDKTFSSGSSNPSHANSERLMSPGVVDAAYYASLLRTTPLPNPNTPVSSSRSLTSEQHQRGSTPGTFGVKQTNAGRKEVQRPSSAPKTRPDYASVKSTTPKYDNGGFTVSGQKIDSGSKRPKSAYSRYRSEHKPSYVDELLFGKPTMEPDFPSPFGDTSSSTKPLPFVAIASIETPQRQNVCVSNKKKTVPSKASPAVKSNTATKAHFKNRGKQNFSNTYIDEGLFGPKPEEPNFKAPWDKDEQVKPFVFDGTDCKHAQEAGSKRVIGQSETGNKKPVWR